MVTIEQGKPGKDICENKSDFSQEKSVADPCHLQYSVAWTDDTSGVSNGLSVRSLLQESRGTS